MTTENRTVPPTPPTTTSLPYGSRRRLLRGGLATAPVLLTLVNRPVMANELTCRTASALGSANLSRTTSGTFNCRGRKPSSWLAAPTLPVDPWPPGSRTELFENVFGGGSIYTGKTLSEMVALVANTGQEGLAKHLVAAYLNALQGLTPEQVLSVVTVKNIWASFVARGFYEPTAGIQWFPDTASVPNSTGGGLIAWLLTTMPG